MSEPTRQEIIDAYRELYMLLGFYQDRNPERAPKTRAIIENALPPCPRPTMAEIEWDDEEHFLAEAEDTFGGHFLMLGKWDSFSVQCLELNTLQGRIIGAKSLTPTGKRYTLTEVQE